VLQLYGGLRWSIRDEPDLDLAGVHRVRVVPPFAVDLPGDDQPVRWLPLQHTTPVALAAVNAALVPAPSAASHLNSCWTARYWFEACPADRSASKSASHSSKSAFPTWSHDRRSVFSVSHAASASAASR
jgi:hypothetical protein